MTRPFVPYGRQIIDDGDIAAVIEVLKSDWLTTGPAVTAFEDEFSGFVGADHGIAVANGTAALHLCMLAAGVGPGDEVIVTALTFAASANCARYVGADVVFADVLDDTLTIDPAEVERLITPRTRAIVAVDYAGVPCDLDHLVAMADRHGLTLIEDACHAPGGVYRGRKVGSIADMSTFSFHPVKHLATGEGGMITTNDPDLAARLRRLRNHGIDTDFRQREERGTWAYDVVELGFNYRLPDLSCALGSAQLRHLPSWLERRAEIAKEYDDAFAEVDGVRTLEIPSDRSPAWHLYPVRLSDSDVRAKAFEVLRSNGIGVNVHYQPVYLHTYYRQLGFEPGLCPRAEQAYEGLLSLPMWPGLDPVDQGRVIDLLVAAIEHG